MAFRRRQQVTTVGVAVVATALSLAACSSSSSSSTASTGSTASSSSASSSSAALSGTLNGSGSTLQLTYQEAAISAFKTVQSGMTVNYGAGGSGKGRTDLASGVVNYAASDSPIPASEVSTFNGKTVLYFPDVIAPVTVSYNLSGLSKPLQLSAPVIASIFQAKITTWNNSAIAADNPGVTLPSTPITIAVRSDSSGTTQNFTQFLVDATGDGWTLGTSSTIKWPSTARAGNGNGGVASIIKSTPGAIGYVDYSDAKASGLTFASIKNKAGDYVAPSVVRGLRRRRTGHHQAPNLTFTRSGGPAPAVPDHLSVMGPGLRDPAERQRRGHAQGVDRLPDRSRASKCPRLGYAPLPSSLDQMATAQLSKIGMLGISIVVVMHDQIGSLS